MLMKAGGDLYPCLSEEFQKDDTILTEAMLYAAKEKERLEEKEKKARELYFSYEEQVEKNGQTQSDDE